MEEDLFVVGMLELQCRGTEPDLSPPSAIAARRPVSFSADEVNESIPYRKPFCHVKEGFAVPNAHMRCSTLHSLRRLEVWYTHSGVWMDRVVWCETYAAIIT